ALIGAFGFLGWSIWKNNRPSKPTEIKILPETIRPASASVETARTEDGQQVATFLSYPKYYQNDKKEFVPVETDIVKNEAGDIKLPSGVKADWKVDKGVWKFYATNDGAVASDNAGVKLETKLKSLVYFDAETKKIATIYSADTLRVVPQPIVAQNQIIWPSIIEGIDYKITYINDLMKEEIVMSDAARKKLPPPESLGINPDNAYLGFLFDRSKEQIGELATFAVDKNGRQRVDYGIKGFETEGSVEFMDDKGNKVQTIEAGYTSLNAQNPNDKAQSSNQVQNPPSTSSGQANNPAANASPQSEPKQADGQIPLLKRFYKEKPGEVNGKKFLFSGSKFSDIKNLGEGDLLFDPTVSFRKGDGGSYSEVDDTWNHTSTSIQGTRIDYQTANASGSIGKALIKFPQFIGSASGQVPVGSIVSGAYVTVTTLNSTGYGSAATANIYKILDQWTEGNCECAVSSGYFGATYVSAQDKYNTETAYINNASGITASDASVTVDNGSGGGITIADWPAQGIFKIDSEVISYTGRTSTSFTGLIRGASGTTAATHSDNAVIDGKITWVASGGADGPAGGSVSGSSYASFVPAAINTAYTVDIKTLAQEWVDNPNANYGMMIYINDPDEADFYSSEFSDVTKRPKLRVFYGASGSGVSGLVNAYESNDTSVSPSSPGTVTTLQKMEYATQAQDSGFWTTALSTTDNGYDSQVFKMQVPSASATVPITVNWKGHGESAATNNTVGLNIWNFNSSAWEQLSSGAARYNDTFTDKTSALNTATSWSTNAVNELAFDSVNNMIYVGGGVGNTSKFARYSPSGDSFTDLSAKADNEITAMAFDSANKEIYLGEHNGAVGLAFEKYNPITDSVTVLTSKISSFWSTSYISALAFDSARNIIYLGGTSGKFAKYNPATDVATDLTSKISSFWSTNAISASALDSTNGIIYLGGEGGRFAKYDPATDTATDLTTILGWSTSTGSIRTLTFDSISNSIYVGGYQSGIRKISRYIPALNIAEELTSYLPSTMNSSTGLYASVFDPSNKTVYFGGNYSSVARYFPSSLSSQSLTNTVYDTIGSIQLNASAFDTTNKVLYIGGASGKFGKYAVSSNTTLTGTVSTNIQNYRDSSGYAWLWVKATNESTPPSVSAISAPSGGTTTTVTWTSGEGADGAVAYATSSKSSWDAYTNFAYETDAGWKTSHSVTISTTCNPATTYYYRVRSCDSWGSCTVSAENTTTTTDCAGTCLHLYFWDGKKWQFKTDTFASGGLAYVKGGIKGFVVPIPHELYALESQLEEKDGAYEIRVFSDLSEVDYFDQMQLLSYVIPDNLELGTENPSFGAVAGSKTVVHTIDPGNLFLPKSATLIDTGEDIKNAVSKQDNNRLLFNPDTENYSYKTMEFDFGDLSPYQQKKLVVVGSSAFPDTKEGIDRKKLFGPAEILEVQDEQGDWQTVPAGKTTFAKPVAFEKRQVFDISNIFLTKNTKLRIKYLYKTRLDQVAVDVSPDYSFDSVQSLPLESADLEGNNFYHPYKRGETIPDYYVTQKRDSEYFGNYTRYGEVAPLLKEQDDKLVIVAKGDEITTRFKVPTDDIPAGMKRAYLVSTWGYYKAEGKSQVPMTVEPLPFAKMSNFPYPKEEYPYANDADYQNYLKTYNTRLIDKDHKFTDYLPWQEKINSDVKDIFEKGKNFLDNLNLQELSSWRKFGGEYQMHAQNSNGSA
ncbi:MAG: hypothetical protein AAB511_01370, partial [Patescibacteria group bacterium]